MRLPNPLAMLAIAVLFPVPPAAAQGDWFAYVGTYTRGASKGIYAFRFQPASGKLTPAGLAGETSNPSFLAAHPSRRYLYAVNENDAGTLSAFAIDPATGRLKLLNQVSSEGSGPCHISVDQAGRWLFAANYGSGSVAAFPIARDGSLGKASAVFQHAGNSADPQRQSGPHAHMAAVSPDNRFVWVADLGLDEILSYRLDGARGGMTPNVPPWAKMPAGSGPRHLVFRPDGKFVYVMSEIGSSVTVCRYHAARGVMEPIQVIPTLPAGYEGQKWGAEIALHPDSRFLYASNRGHDSIAIFRVDAAAGTLTALGQVPSGGRTPRSFAIDPTGGFLLAANQNSNSLVVFRVDSRTGGLTATGETLEAPTPVSVVFVSAAAQPRGAGGAALLK